MRYDQHDELEQCLTAMRLKCQKEKWQWDTGLLWGVKILLACYRLDVEFVGCSIMSITVVSPPQS